MRKIPIIPKHDLSKLNEGTGSSNTKEDCNCENCKILKTRRDNIFSSPINKFKRWLNNNF